MRSVDCSTWALSGVADVAADQDVVTGFASSSRPVRVVVVDLPLVPVIATMRPRSQREASSSSPITGTPAARASAMAGCASGTPGLSTIRSAPRSVSRRWPPSSSSTPDARSSCFGVDLRSLVSVRTALGAAPHEQDRGGDAAARRADDDDPLARDGEWRRRHRSFSVVREKSAKMIATITKRAMTFGSLQPMSSK